MRLRRRPLSIASSIAAATLLISGLAATTLAVAPASAAESTGTLYQAVAPQRVLSSTSLAAGASSTTTLSGIPKGATAVWVSLTAARASASSAISLCAGATASQACRSTPQLTASTGVPTSAPVRIELGGQSKITVHATKAVAVALDVAGYSVPTGTTGAGSYSAVATPATVTQKIGDRELVTVTVPGVPAGATAVALAVTSTGFSSATYVSACPAGQDRAACSATSFLNPLPTGDRQKSAIVKLGGSAGNQIQFYNNNGAGTLRATAVGFFRSTAGTGGAIAPVSVSPSELVLAPGASASVPLSGVSKDATGALVRIVGVGAWRATTVSSCATTAACGSTALLAEPGQSSTNTVLLPVVAGKTPALSVRNSSASVRLRFEVLAQVVPVDASSVPTPSRPAPTVPPTPVPVPTPTPTTPAPKPTTPAPTPTPTPPAPAPSPDKAAPGPSNTGVPAGTKLTVVDGDINVTTPGTVIDSVDVHGTIVVKAANVTIKNSIIRGKAGSGPLVNNLAHNPNLVIQDSELFAAMDRRVSGIMGSHFTATRLNIHDVTDGIHLTEGDVTLKDSWLHDNLHLEQDPVWNGTPTHDDTVQIQGGSNITIDHNTMTGAHNAALMITQDRAAVTNLSWTRNYADGGGCTINVAEGNFGPVQGLKITDNTFGRTTKIANCAIIAPTTTKIDSQRNYFADDKSPISIRKG